MATTTEQQRAEAKLRAAIASMGPAMKAASDAAHELMELKSDAASDFERMMVLGLITQILGKLCTVHAKMLYEIIHEHFAGEERHISVTGARKASPGLC